MSIRLAERRRLHRAEPPAVTTPGGGSAIVFGAVLWHVGVVDFAFDDATFDHSRLWVRRWCWGNRRLLDCSGFFNHPTCLNGWLFDHATFDDSGASLPQVRTPQPPLEDNDGDAAEDQDHTQSLFIDSCEVEFNDAQQEDQSEDDHGDSRADAHCVVLSLSLRIPA